MSPRERSFRWKIVYLVSIAGLLFPLYFLGTPATTGVEGSGGKLARLRADPDYNLSQKHLGQIDATSETIKLGTLGLRGVAANILWGKAHLYKKKKDWTNLEATVEQITKLQPHFISVWIFQGWNLSYNVSAEFDGYRDRYHYVIKGVEFLERGVEKNDREPRLPWEVGWVISQKIGRADESKQFRRLFKEDDDFHRKLPFQVLGTDPRDNWLVGKEYFQIATVIVDTKGVTMRGKGPLIYRSSEPMAQINYADARASEGHLGEVTQQAWRNASREWFRYGSIDIPTSTLDDRTGRPVEIHLNDLEKYQELVEETSQELRGLEPGLRERIKKEKEAELTDEQRRVLDIPPHKRTGKQQAIASKAEELIEVTHQDVARGIKDRTKRARAVHLVRDLLPQAEAMANLIGRYREIVNFNYWRLRANVEQTDEAMAAHESIYQADRVWSGDEPNLIVAKQNYEKGLAAWRKVLDKFPEAVTDETFGEDLMEVIQRYRELLDRCDKKQERKATYGEDFILADIVKLYQQEEADETQ